MQANKTATAKMLTGKKFEDIIHTASTIPVDRHIMSYLRREDIGIKRIIIPNNKSVRALRSGCASKPTESAETQAEEKPHKTTNNPRHDKTGCCFSLFFSFVGICYVLSLI